MAATATLNWTPSITAGSYFVQYRVKGTEDWIIPNNEPNPTMNSFYHITGLEEGTLYEFKIVSECCDGSTEQIIEGATSCPPTDSLTVIPIPSTSFQLNWPAKLWAVEYNVYFKPQASLPYLVAPGSPVAPNGTATETLTIGGLEVGVTYEFAVEVVCASGVSSKVINIGTNPCPNITNLAVVFITNTANLTWNSSLSGQQFRVEFKKASDLNYTVWEASQTATTAAIPNLDYNTEYSFRVTGLCGAFTSNSLTVGGTVLCPPISNLANSTNLDDVTLTWDNGYAGQTVKIEHKVSTDMTWILDVDNYGPASSYTVMNLPLGFTYDFRVTGKCGNFEINSLTTQATLSCPSVTDLVAANV